jgi:hypothetical protein
VLIPAGSAWRYLDRGTDPGAAWNTAGYDDSGWSSGIAQLGFGDGDEATVIRQTTTAGAPIVTFYFRHVFTSPDVSGYTNLLLRLRRDDGAAVYLNATEVFRSNLPPGPLSNGTLAATTAEDDGMLLFAAPVNASRLVAGNNVVAVEVHQAATNSSDVSFDLELQANVVFQVPSVSLAYPAPAEVLGAANMTMVANASDEDGEVSIVQFYANGVQLGTATNAPFTYTESNIVAGAYSLVAVAVDNTGLSVTSAPVAVTVAPRLVASGTDWKYLDDGSDPGSNWANPTFNDSGWSNGIAELGFGDGDEATLLRQFSTITGTNGIAYYFRRSFDLASTAGITNLVLRLVRDDGAIVRLNGTEVFRINMPTGTVTSRTFAAQAIANDNSFHGVRVNPSLLVTGRNVLAVEMHQYNLTSSDLSFDLQLLPNIPPTPPQAALVSPTNGAVFFGPTNIYLDALATDFDQSVTSVVFTVNGTRVGTDTTDNYEIDGHNFSFIVSNLDVGAYSLRMAATDAGGLVRTSAPVNIQVLYAPVQTTFIPTGSVWKYFDAGTDLGTSWRTRDFNDGAWPTGRGKLGFNDNPATPIQLVTTAYFRYRFNVLNAASYTNLLFRVLRDDGVVVYLNGVELFRSNMPNGPVAYDTYASTPIGGANESYYMPTNTAADALLVGENLLAVELHQSSGTSDAGFDLGLVGIALPAPIAPALNIYRSGNGLLLTWPGSGFSLQDAPVAGGPYATRVTGTNTYSIPNPTGNRFYRLFKP